MKLGTTAGRAATLLFGLILGAGCSSGEGDEVSPSKPASGASSTSASQEAGDAPPPPEVGQCRNTPPSNLGENDWVDESPVVDCSQPHTLETAEVLQNVEGLTLATVKELFGSCRSATTTYLNDPEPGLSTLAFPFVTWPSVEQRAAGQAWVRCDVGVQAKSECCPPLASVTGSVHNALGDDPTRFQQCLDVPPDPERSQLLTSCQQPHKAELLMSPLSMTASSYPTAATLDKEGRSQCASLVADRDDVAQLVLTPVWQSEDGWSSGTLYGGCWIHRQPGRLPAV